MNDAMIKRAYMEICGLEKEAARGSKRQQKKNMKNAIKAWDEAPLEDKTGKPLRRVGEAMQHYDYMREKNRKAQIHENYKNSRSVQTPTQNVPGVVSPVRKTENVPGIVSPVRKAAENAEAVKSSAPLNVKPINRGGNWNGRGNRAGSQAQQVRRPAPSIAKPTSAPTSAAGSVPQSPIKKVVNMASGAGSNKPQTSNLPAISTGTSLSPVSRTTNALASTTQSSNLPATKQGFRPTKKQLAIGGAAAAGLTAAGLAAYGIHRHNVKKRQAQQAEQAQKTASELLEDLTDIVSRYEVYEKTADTENMQAMEKEAADVKKAIKAVKEGYKKVVKSRAGRTAASVLDNAWRGAAAGALTGAASGAMSEYRQPDGKVDKKKNIMHGIKNGAIMGGVGGAGWGLFKGNEAIFRGGKKKTAAEELDGLYKQAISAAMVGGTMTGLHSIKGLGKQFMKGYSGAEGNMLGKAMSGVKNIGLKGASKAIGRTIAGTAIGAGIDGAVNAFKNQDMSNPYNQ